MRDRARDWSERVDDRAENGEERKEMTATFTVENAFVPSLNWHVAALPPKQLNRFLPELVQVQLLFNYERQKRPLQKRI